jgi:hypothetical protein
MTGDGGSAPPPSDTVAPDATTTGSVPATTGGAATGDATSSTTTSSITSGPDPTSTSTSTSTTTSATTGDATTTDPGAPASTTGDDGTTTSSTSTTSTSSTTGDETTMAGSTGAPEPWTPKACASIYDHNLLPTFVLEVEPGVLAKLKAEWAAQNGDKPKHKLKLFKYEDIEITNASIELRGNKKWWPDLGRMQFEISFNTYDKKGRFLGLKSILFDAARYNESMLRDRMAMQILRDAGLPAPCANNAKIMLNGEYYGLFTHLEKVDSEFLERYFEFPDGNLYKRDDWEKKNNEEDEDDSDIEALTKAKNIAQLDAAMNLDEAVLEWATEAVMPDNDGAWSGGLNYFVYNDPLTGFVVIPWDKDSTFTRVEYNVDPYTYIKPMDHGRPFYDIATDDPQWFAQYIADIAFVLETAYQVDVLQTRHKQWAEQIKTAVQEDPTRPFSFADHLDAVKEERAYFKKRHDFVKKWLECWQNGGTKDANGKCKKP